MSGLWARYNKLLEAQPLLTKCLTSLTGFTAGDVLAQNFVEDSSKPYDIMRTVRLGSFGFLIHGSTGHYFYGFLDSKLPGTKPVTVASKVFIDQTIWNPIFGCMFFGYLNLVEGKSWDDYTKKLQADLKTAVMGSWAVWVPAHSKSDCHVKKYVFLSEKDDILHMFCFVFLARSYQLCLRPAFPASALHQHHPNRIQRLPFLPWKQVGGRRDHCGCCLVEID